jgi:hypothetical protein
VVNTNKDEAKRRLLEYVRSKFDFGLADEQFPSDQSSPRDESHGQAKSSIYQVSDPCHVQKVTDRSVTLLGIHYLTALIPVSKYLLPTDTKPSLVMGNLQSMPLGP